MNSISVTRQTRFVPALAPVVRTIALAALALTLLTLLLVITRQNPGGALRALWLGAFGSWYAVWSVTLVRAVPLALTGLAVAVAFRTGILNIGAEGQLLVGATTAVAIAGLLSSAPTLLVLPIALVLGSAAGAVWAGVAAWLRHKFGVLEVISTIMLNFIAQYAVGYLVRGPLQEPTRINPQSFMLSANAQLPVIFPGTRLHAGFVVAVVLSLATWWWFRSTASGFRLRAVGANPFAAASAGQINVARAAAIAFLVSGALAGLAGAIEVTGVTYALYENLSPGYGFTAIAVALMARLNPLGVLVTALLFGALEAGANAMQRDANVPVALVQMVEALLILFVVAADRLKTPAVASEIGT